MPVYDLKRVTEAQNTLNNLEPGIRQELDIQREHYPEIYAGAHLFCQEARAGRVTAYDVTLDQRQLDARNLHSPCGCYYGAGSQYNTPLALMRSEDMRKACGSSFTPIEHALFICADLEGEQRIGPLRIKKSQYPLPWDNPALQQLVNMVEEHLATNAS